MKTFASLILILLFTVGSVKAQDTLYFYKAGMVFNKHAVNQIDSITFTGIKPLSGIVSDIDGNHYNWIKIGTQTWMTENLKTTKFRSGEMISNVTGPTIWSGATFAAWCDYQNNLSYGTKYGHLYNYYAVKDSRNIAPVGWHIPSDNEWNTLLSYVTANSGYSCIAAKALAATTDWNTTTNTYYPYLIGLNINLNNSSGFNALPAGYTYNFSITSDMDFLGIKDNAYWWSCNQSIETWHDPNTNVGHYFLLYGSKIEQKYFPFERGLSVRCIKD